MFAGLRSAARAQARENAEPKPDRVLPLEVVDSHVPHKFSLLDLKAEVTECQKSNLVKALTSLFVTEACLRDQDRIRRVSGDEAAAAWLYQWVSDALHPPPEVMPRSEYEKVGEPESMDGHLVLFWRVSWLGIQIVRQLDTMDSVEKYDERVHVFLSLAIYTDKRDVWTTEASFAGASSLLEEHSDAARKPEVLVEHILRGVIRPRFAKSKNPAITAQGRKAIAPPRRVYEAIHEEADAKPWKFKEVYLLTVLRWTLQNLDKSLVEANWPLVIPPILTLFDDDYTSSKRIGSELLSILLDKTPSSLLARTGLGEVLHDALMPCLLSLPTLTPQTESVSLLSGAYPALLKLARTRHPENGQERSRLLDQVFRQGILRGHAHCTGNIGISTLLLRQTEAIIHEMGLSSVKHLKDILPMVNEHLTSPFITASHSLLLACVATLQTLIVTVWPRIPFHRTTILLGLCSAWCRLAPDVGALTGGTTAANEALRHTFKLLRAVCSKEVARAEVDFDAEFERLVAADQTLAGVFE